MTNDSNNNPAQHWDAVPVAPWEYTEGDALIFAELRQWPLPIMTLLNRVARKIPCSTGRQRKAVKWALLKRLTTLIRSGQLRRFRRRFVCLPGYQFPNEVPAYVLNMLSQKGGSGSRRKKRQN